MPYSCGLCKKGFTCSKSCCYSGGQCIQYVKEVNGIPYGKLPNTNGNCLCSNCYIKMLSKIAKIDYKHAINFFQQFKDCFTEYNKVSNIDQLIVSELL